MADRLFCKGQIARFRVFENFPNPEWDPEAVREFVEALCRCESDAHAKEVVDHFIETATKFPSVASLLAQIRVTADKYARRNEVAAGCAHCGGTGYVIETRMYKGTPVEGARRCTCMPSEPQQQPKAATARDGLRRVDPKMVAAGGND